VGVIVVDAMGKGKHLLLACYFTEVTVSGERDTLYKRAKVAKNKGRDVVR
jgi:hypothetical protein